jgi:hypothetical protein
VTLTGLSYQGFPDFGVVISDQTPEGNVFTAGEVKAAVRLLQRHHTVREYRHLPKRGMAEQRHFLVSLSVAPYVLFLDDDLVLDPWVVEVMLAIIREEGCGFVGCAPIGLSYVGDKRPDEQHIEFLDGRVRPETVRPDTPSWERYKLHNAANIFHVQEQMGLTPETRRTYRIAWVGGCVLYDREKLMETGGFSFWHLLPPNHAGEEIVAQLRLMSLYGGCGIIPSGVFHQELPTTVPDRKYDAPRMIKL